MSYQNRNRSSRTRSGSNAGYRREATSLLGRLLYRHAGVVQILGGGWWNRTDIA